MARKIRLSLDPETMLTKLRIIDGRDEFEIEQFEVEELKELYKQALVELQRVKHARSHRKPRRVRVHPLPEVR